MVEIRKDPVFVVGDARSGTTLLASLLIQHKEVGLAPETKFVKKMMKIFGKNAIASSDNLSQALDIIYQDVKFYDLKIRKTELLQQLSDRLPLLFPELVRTILRSYCQQEFPGCKVWGVKKGSYVRSASRLIEFFPNAQFINIVRDGRAVFSSKKKAIHSQTGQPFETDPVRAAERWVKAIQKFDNFKEKYPQNSLEVSYEGLVNNSLKVLTDAFHFLKVTPDPLIASQVSESVTSSWVPKRYKQLHINIGKPPQLSRIDAWKQELTDDEIQAFESVAGRELDNKGYEFLHQGLRQESASFENGTSRVPLLGEARRSRVKPFRA